MSFSALFLFIYFLFTVLSQDAFHLNNICRCDFLQKIADGIFKLLWNKKTYLYKYMFLVTLVC